MSREHKPLSAAELIGAALTLSAKHNAALSARLAEVEAELAREREDARDIPTIAYMSGAADWKARATRAEAELAECKHELSSLRNTLDDLVAIQRERAEQAEAERDEAHERIDALEWLVEVQESRPPVMHMEGDLKMVFTDPRRSEYRATLDAARAAAGV